MQVEVKESFKTDFSAIMRRELEEAGFDTSGISEKDLPIKYFTISMRLIEKRPRVIYKAADFVCPPDLEAGLQLLESKITNGDSLFPHQSTSVSRLTTEDKMLYSWTIHHFHLGTTLDNRGFIQRTGPVLFAFVTDDAVYMIDIKPHGSWSDKGLIQKLYDNWPQLLESWKVDGEPVVNFGSEEIKELRKANVNTILMLDDGSSFVGPGFGVTTAGTPADASLKVGDIFRHMDRFVRDLKKDPSDFLRTIYSEEEINQMTEVSFDFHLEVTKDYEVLAVDSIHGIYQVFFKQQMFLKDKK